MRSILLIKKFLGLVEMTFGLVYASLSLASHKNNFLCTLQSAHNENRQRAEIPSVHKAGLIRYMRVCDLGHKIKVMCPLSRVILQKRLL